MGQPLRRQRQVPFGSSVDSLFQISNDASNWTTIVTDTHTASTNGAIRDYYFAPVSTRYVRFYASRWNQGWGWLREMQVFAEGYATQGTLAKEDPCLCPNREAFQDDPVNAVSGNFTYQKEDIAIPTAGLPLRIERSYNSLDGRQGPLGYGWTHNYDMRLLLNGNEVTLLSPKGSRLIFNRYGSSGFVAPQGVRATLVQNGDGTYTLTYADQRTYVFDSSGNLTKEQDRNGNANTLSYTFGRLTGVTDLAGRSIELSYDGSDRLSLLRDPISRTVGYGYDQSGNLAVVTDTLGFTTTFGCDALNRPTKVTYPDSEVQYAYDALGNRQTMTDTLGVTSYSYDALSRPTGLTFPGDLTVGYGYDAAGNRTRLTYPDGKVLTSTYDLANRLTGVTDCSSRVVTYTYDAGNRLTGVLLPNQTQTAYSYDLGNRLMAITNTSDLSGTLSYFQYGLDGVGNRTAVTETTGTANYGYDLLYRLTSVTFADATTQYKLFDGHKGAVAVDTASQLITAVAVLAGNSPDNEKALELVEQSEQNAEVEVEETIGDCAFGDGTTRQQFAQAGRKLVAKVPDRPNSAQIPKEDFRIDLASKTCICPAGQKCRTLESIGRRKDHNGESQERLGFKFDPAICTACALRPSCVEAGPGKGRTVSLHPQEGLLQEARAFQRSGAFSPYRQLRQTAEHRLARLMQLGMRQARHFGRVKTLFQLLMAATADIQAVAGFQKGGVGVRMLVDGPERGKTKGL